MAEVAETTEIGGDTPMGDILKAFPGAKRNLFARYHIGGCQSCSYRDEETLAEVCERNEGLPVDEVIEHILTSHESDQKMMVDSVELKNAIESASPPRLIDLRTREEYEAVKLPNAVAFSNDLLQEIFAEGDKERLTVFYDHMGDRSLDAAAYLVGHGFTNTKALRGGIDAYSQEADPEVPRYKLEFEE